MTPELSVLEAGRARRRQADLRAWRRRRRRRRVLFAIAVVALTLVALLVLTTSRTAGPAQTTLLRPKAHRQPVVPGRHVPTIKPTYGAVTMPAADQIHPRVAFHVRSAILFDVWTGRVLWSQRLGLRVPIASLTKMMTALLVARHTRPHDQVLITRTSVHFSGSGVGLLPLGKRLPVSTLLYGLLLPSGNDAAIALAEHVAGSQAHFVALMNREAQAMGLTCTHFTSVSGIVDRGNYSCTTDLAVLAHTLLQNPLLGRIVASRSAVLRFPVKGGKLYLYNNNPLLLTRFPGTDGVKTGYTVAAGRCLVAAARRGRTWLGVVLLNSVDPGGQAEKLLNAGFAKLATR